MISPNIKNFIIAAVIIGGGFWLYSAFFVKSADDSSLLVTPAESEAVFAGNSDGSRILSILSNMKTILIDKNFFSEPAFTQLKDYSVSLGDEQKGRQNPFLSAEANVSSSANSAPDTATGKKVE
jgi:hypothetical protein